MENITDILNELNRLSSVVAAIPRVNVFTVPAGYFESIQLTLMAGLQHEHQPSVLIDNADQIKMVPEGYFAQLAGSVLDKIKSLDTIAAPDTDLSPLLYKIRNKNVFEVPDGYFDNLSKAVMDDILAVDAKEELKEVSPLLFMIRDKNVYDVPANYFSDLPASTLKKIHPQTARVLHLPRRSALIKYTVAAAVTGILALGAYTFFNKSGSSAPVENTGLLASLDASIEKGKKMDDKQFNESLNNLTGTDIAKYLEKNGDITDVAALDNNIEDNVLPSQDDYLLDEATLDNYLKEIDKTPQNN